MTKHISSGNKVEHIQKLQKYKFWFISEASWTQYPSASTTSPITIRNRYPFCPLNFWRRMPVWLLVNTRQWCLLKCDHIVDALIAKGLENLRSVKRGWWCLKTHFHASIIDTLSSYVSFVTRFVEKDKPWIIYSPVRNNTTGYGGVLAAA